MRSVKPMLLSVLFLVAPALADKPTAVKAAPPTTAKAPRTVELSVTTRGFEPSPVNVKKGEPLRLVVTRKTEETCATQIVVKGYNITKDLPLNQPVEIAFTPTESGELRYGCAMGMMVSGTLLVE